MITNSTLDFLRGLKANNTREWFMEHKPAYERAYSDFLDTVVQLVALISAFDPVIAAESPDPKACIMRIYRDVRFSKDKTPYKTGFFAFINKGGKKSPCGGYYLHLEPGASFVGGGIYMPESSVLEKTRREIDLHFPEWRKIVGNREMLRNFPEGVRPSGQTKRPPKGYDETNPAIGYLKFKGYVTQRFFSDDELMVPQFADTVAEAFRSVKPMIDFLNRAL